MKKLLFFTGIAWLVISCNTSGGSAAGNGCDSLLKASNFRDSVLDRNKTTALNSLRAFSERKVDDVLKNAAADAVDYGDGSMSPIKGLDSIKASIKAFLDAFPDYKGENFLAIGEGNHVAVFADWSGTFKNPLMGLKPTGKSFKIRDVDLFTFNDEGKVTEHRSVVPGQTIMEMVQAKIKK
jgi:predicted ester cyclase